MSRDLAEVVYTVERPHRHDKAPTGTVHGDIVRCQCGRLGKVVDGDYTAYATWWRPQWWLRRKIDQ